MKNALLLLVIYFLFSCVKHSGECEEPLFVTNSSVVVDFKDSLGKYLYSEVLPTYNKDSLKVIEETSGSPLVALYTLNNIPNTSSRYWRISIGPLYTESMDASSYDREICKNFILRYKVSEFDTIKTCFKSVKTKCGSVFETLKVYYKGQLIATKNNDTYALITIIK